jgi:hypothetical protein
MWLRRPCPFVPTVYDDARGRMQLGRRDQAGLASGRVRLRRQDIPAIISACFTITSACLIEAMSTRRPL